MSRVLRRLRAFGGSGWLPALVVLLLLAGLLHSAAKVSVGDIILFAGYVLTWITLPGTIAWRLLDPRQRHERRPLSEDLAIGALLGYVIEFPVYLLCLAIGHPRFYLVWPLVALAVALVVQRRRPLLHLGAPAERTPWRWTTSALMCYLVVWFAHQTWSVAPVTTAGLSTPYVDEPFHLSLAVGLKHVFPPRYPYVDGTPLQYHWLSHLHVAAASWITGIEPVVLLRCLAIPTLFLIVAFAASRILVRLTGASWTQPVLLAGLLVAPTSFTGWTIGAGESLLSTRLVASPSAGFVNAALLLGVLVIYECLMSRTIDLRLTILFVVLFIAMAGAKSTSLPPVMAGAAAATLVASLLQRRLFRVGAIVTGAAVIAFVIAQLLFFGAGAHGLGVDPLRILTTQVRLYPSLADGTNDMSELVRIVAATSYVAYLSLAAPLVGLLIGGGWRKPERVFLVATCAAGFGATLTFHQSSYSEYYFQYAVLVVLLVGAVLGLHALTESMPRRFVLTACLVGPVLALLASALLLAVTTTIRPADLHGSQVWQAIRLYTIPVLVMLGLVILLTPMTTALAALSSKRPDLARKGLVLSAVMVLVGLGLAGNVSPLRQLVDSPLPGPRPLVGRPLIGTGGIGAARWVRAHVPADQVIATNAHCYTVGAVPPCDARNFWMAAYSEHTFLVEGWSYISWSTVGKDAPVDQSTIDGPFWNPTELAVNDAALLHPSQSTVERLRTRYDVRWVLIDSRFPVKMAKLRQYFRVVHREGGYIVLRAR